MKVLKIGATWCAGCIVMKPKWQKVEKENPWLQTEYYDFDEDKNIVEKYNLKSEKLPIFIFLDKNENVLERLGGEYSEKEILEKINDHKDK